jgi:hypothetical protein
VRQLDRVVIGQQVAERSQADSPGALQGLGDQQVGSRALGRAELFDLFETSADAGERRRVPRLR